MDHATDHHAELAPLEEEAVQHPLGIYFKIWALLFVLSAMSYAVDYFHVQGYLRWFLILTFMLLKAGLIVAVFMHMVWERLAMVYFILLPPLLLMVLVGIGALEADYTFFTRAVYFLQELVMQVPAAHHPGLNSGNPDESFETGETMSDHGGSNKSYVVHALVMLAFTAALGVLAFGLVIHHRAVPERVNEVHATR